MTGPVPAQPAPVRHAPAGQAPVRQALRDRVDQLCREFEAQVDGADRQAVHSARSILAEPLRVAVVGRVSTGKSTLVNALVGRRIAPTRAGECTRVVTWYRFGAPDRAQLHLLDGTVRAVALIDGGLPESLDVPTEEVSRLEVRLASGPLRDLTLIDTPGLDTLSGANDAATRREVLGEASQQAAGQADALLHLIGDAARHSDLAFLSEFRASSGSLTATSLNAIGVLSQADRFGTGPFDPEDPFEIAERLAARLATDHRRAVSSVVAVSGLLAETARTGAITEDVAARLAALADEDPLLLTLRLAEPELAGVGRLFGPHGVRTGRDHAREGATRLGAWAESVSGVGRLEAAVRTQLVPRADVLRAIRTFAVLRRIVRSLPRDVADRGRDLIEAAALDPAAHPIREFQALAALLDAVPGSSLVAELESFVDGAEDVQSLAPGGTSSGADQVEVIRGKAAAATRAATLAQHPAEIEAGRVLARSYFLLARRMSAGVA